MSNEQKTISVSREMLELAWLELVDRWTWADELRALLDAPAVQHQGERVYQVSDGVSGWDDVDLLRYTACSLNPEEYEVRMLYANPAPADSGEIERLKVAVELAEGEALSAIVERDELRDQLAERDALLLEIRGQSGSSWLRGETQHKLDAALSAGTEPSSTVELCNTCKGYGKYQDGDSGTDEDGRAPNIVECECDDSERMPQYRAVAPVERDERVGTTWWRTPERDAFEEWAEEEAEIRECGSTIGLSMEEHTDRYCMIWTQTAWVAWQARAALERKPSALVDQLQADLTQRDERVDDLATRLSAQTELLKQIYEPLMEVAMEYDDKFESLAEEVAELIKIEDAAVQESVDYVEISTAGRLNGVPAKPVTGSDQASGRDFTPTITIPPGLGKYDGSDNGVD